MGVLDWKNDSLREKKTKVLENINIKEKLKYWYEKIPIHSKEKVSKIRWVC